MSPEALFRHDGKRYWPTEHSLGPWGRGVLHGGPVAGLLAYGIEKHAGAAEPSARGRELIPVRLCVDLYRVVPQLPLALETRTLRQGRRLAVIDAELHSNGVSVAHATGLLVRPSAEPAVTLPQSDGVALPPPDQIGCVQPPRHPVSHATSLELRGEIRHFDGRPVPGLWIRVPSCIVEGEVLSPFARSAIASDWANPVANYGPSGIHHVNADISLYLHRAPEGEWIGLEATRRHSARGVALSDCTVVDLQGPVGRCITASLAIGRTASAQYPRGV